MAGEVNLATVLERIETGTLKDREKAFADLKHILRSTSRLEALKESSIHGIYDVLFRTAINERSTYLKARTTTTRAAAYNRLSSCSSSLRVAVEATVRSIKLRTINLVFDHVIETLLAGSGGFCEPLAVDYAKCLRAILNYQPHVEHLAQKDWNRLTSFCVDCIDTASSELVEDHNYANNDNAITMRMTDGLSYRSSRSLLNHSNPSQADNSFSKQVAEVMVACIALLIAAPNASLGSQAGPLLTVLIGSLRNSTIAGRICRDAFGAINYILIRIRTENTVLVRENTIPIVRLVRNFWSLKTSKELLVTLMYLRPYIFFVMRNGKDVALRSELNGLYLALTEEYTRRKERDQMQIDDLKLESASAGQNDTYVIRHSVFSLRCSGVRAESNWAIIYLMASLCNILSDEVVEDDSVLDSDDIDSSDRPRKRQRLDNRMDHLIESFALGSSSSRVCAMQTFTFLAQQRLLDIRYTTKAIDVLSTSCADDNSNIASWAFLALTSLSTQSKPMEISSTNHWISTWHLGIRAITNTSTCRAACHMLDVLLEQRLASHAAISEFIQTLSTSMDLNGPSTLAESAVHLLSHMCYLSQNQYPASAPALTEGALDWVFRYYTPSRFNSRHYASQQNLVDTVDITRLVGRCLQQSVNSEHPEFVLWDTIGQTLLACVDQAGLVDYLLLEPEGITQSKDAPSLVIESSTRGSTAQVKGESLILNFFMNELHHIQDLWVQIVKDSPHTIGRDIFTSFCDAVCTSAAIAYLLDFQDYERQSSMQRLVKSLFNALHSFLNSVYCQQDQIDIMLTVLSRSLTCTTGFKTRQESSPLEKMCCRLITETMDTRSSGSTGIGQSVDEDYIDVEDAEDSQASRHDDNTRGSQDFQTEYAAMFSQHTLRSSITTYAKAITLRDESTSELPSSALVDYLLSLPQMVLLSSSKVISSLADLGILLSPNDAYRLLEHCTDTVLEAYAYGRSEVALSALLDILSSLASVWTDQSETALYELGSDMYAWFTGTALKGGALSPTVQKRVSTLLLQLCQINTDYGRNEHNSSARTSLFTLIHLGSVSVQYHLASRISSIFKLFVLSTHSKMFDDLQQSLPDDSLWVEGMAIRVLFLAELASTWHSLLRQCTYYIFETAGRVISAAKHSAYCVAKVANKLAFESPKKLFKLFAPQLLHTWLEDHSIATLPFATFQYKSLDELLRGNEAEVTAQLLMRDKEECLRHVSTSLGITIQELARRSFPKALAYCISRDISRPSIPGTDTSESRLRDLIGGKEQLRLLATEQFPTVLGYFFQTLQYDDEQEKWLEKHAEYGYVIKALREIQDFSHSEIALPPSQQPSFKGKYLCDQISRLCRRASRDPSHLWDASSFSLSARMLIDSIDASLGPLQSCLAIRRLRLLICMAGDVAWSGLSVEMLIQCLRPFLSDSQCADDAIGIMKFLLSNGRPYLKTETSFVHGIATLSILQMLRYSANKQDSTTQESQHHATVRKMVMYQDWLVKYIGQCEPSEKSSPSSMAKQKRLSTALASLKLPGNARKNSPESDLLLLFLEQQGDDGNSILPHSDIEEALLLLTNNFTVSGQFEEDCMEDDQKCVAMAQNVWKSLRISFLDPKYLIWAAGVLGKSYAASGNRPRVEAQHLENGPEDKLSSFHGTAKSQMGLISQMCDALRSRDTTKASLADHCLRKIASSFGDDDEAILFERMLPLSITRIVAGGTYGYYPAYNDFVNSAKETDRPLDASLQSGDCNVHRFAQAVSISLCHHASEVTMLSSLNLLVSTFGSFAEYSLPRLMHVLLDEDVRKDGILRGTISRSFKSHLSNQNESAIPLQRYLLHILLFLREQPFPDENTMAERLCWLDIDLTQAAHAAARCEMPTTALLLIESASSPTQISGKRTSSRLSTSQTSVAQLPQDLLLSIFKNVEEPDSFYGVEQLPTLQSVLERLDYERDGAKSLMFRSAQIDTQLRQSHSLAQANKSGIVRSISMLNLNSVNMMLLSSNFQDNVGTASEYLAAAGRLQQWNVAFPDSAPRSSANLFEVFQELSRAEEQQTIRSKVHLALAEHIRAVQGRDLSSSPSQEWWTTLASLAEIGEIIDRVGSSSLRCSWEQIALRQSWMRNSRFDDFGGILANRQTLFSVLVQNRPLQSKMRLELQTCREIEIESLLDLSVLSKDHGRLQEALAAATQLDGVATELQGAGFEVGPMARFQTASVLWELGESTASVRILQDALGKNRGKDGILSVGRSELLAELAHELAEARLERPEDVLTKYLKPAIAELEGSVVGREAGKVFHEFATYCDSQLQNSGNIEDFNRIVKLRQHKLEEVQQLEQMSKKGKKTGDNSEYKHLLKKAKQWFEIDDADFQRIKSSRDTFVQQSLQNYLLALHASDQHNISVLRFFALWLESSSSVAANSIVGKHLPKVSSWKFVRLLNQLMSRLEQDSSAFQDALFDLVSRICADHPIHSLHHLYASTRKPQSRDQVAVASRVAKASEIRLSLIQKFKEFPQKAELLRNWFIADNLYSNLAWESTESLRGTKVAVRDFKSASNVSSKIPDLRVPPATINVPLRPDCDYTNVPIVVRFDSTMRLMSGLSKPKKMVALASTGQQFAALFKSGNDDLRQDAIMEQVFEEVSNMLQDHKATRQRALQIRTYKVIPLLSKSGIIEFVPNSTSLSDFLTPAHARYYPNDYKPSTAREKINAVKEHSTEVRLKEFRKICDHMHPVLRHFFFEKYTNPDEWFTKRTSYTRTTASVSILGHVLGLGDRHCQNIMLDEKTGEVVHIDLGVAFEAGRVLPVPELVPFRLTRDIVDGMGITKTEGVFRRCCEFTLDALRRDKGSIMTLLNVLRYDPLYQWTISPVKAKRMQDANDTGDKDHVNGGKIGSSVEVDAGEAERALSIVEKKLSQTLSTSATVNELIQQATDERNLATLFSGWAAYF